MRLFQKNPEVPISISPEQASQLALLLQASQPENKQPPADQIMESNVSEDDDSDGDYESLNNQGELRGGLSGCCLFFVIVASTVGGVVAAAAVCRCVDDDRNEYRSIGSP